MVKLTEAQRELLERMASGASLSYSTLTGSIWSSDGRFTIKVNASTFNALSLRKLIEPQATEKATTVYRISTAGRAALADGGRDE